MVAIDYPNWATAPFEEIEAWVRLQCTQHPAAQLHVTYEHKTIPLIYALMERLHGAEYDRGMTEEPRTCPTSQTYGLIKTLLDQGASWTTPLDPITGQMQNSTNFWWTRNDLSDRVAMLNERYHIKHRGICSFSDVVQDGLGIDISLAVCCMQDSDLFNHYMEHTNEWCANIHPLLAVSNTLDVLRGAIRLNTTTAHNEPIWMGNVRCLEQSVGTHNAQYLFLGNGPHTTLASEWAQTGQHQGLTYAQSKGWKATFKMLREAWDIFVLSHTQSWGQDKIDDYRKCIELLLPQVFPYHRSERDHFFEWRAFLDPACRNPNTWKTLIVLDEAGFDFECDIGGQGSLKDYLIGEHPQTWAYVAQGILGRALNELKTPMLPSVSKRM